MSTLIAVGMTLAAGAVGAVVRALVVVRATRIGTTLVNLAGTLLLALVLVAQDAGALDGTTALIMGVGLSGSLTTFSGWIALLADGLGERPARTFAVDLMLPLLVAVGLTVLAFAVIAG